MKGKLDSGFARLPAWTKIGYGAGMGANQIMGMGIGFYLLMYYTDIVGISAGWIGIAMSVGRFWDAITDPAMGHISDRTRSQIGRRRPYLMFGAPFLAGAFILIWSVPVGWSLPFVFTYLLIAQLLFTTFQTIVMVPYAALGAELTMDYHERNSIMAYQQGMSFVGFILGSALINLASGFGSWLNPEIRSVGWKGIITASRFATEYRYMDGAGFRIGAIAFAPVVLVLFLISVLATRENPLFQRHASTPPIQSIISTVKNRPFRIYIGAFLVSTATAQIGSFMLPLLVVHWLHQPGRVIHAAFLYASGIVLGLPAWAAVARRVEKKHCFMMSVATGGVVGVFFLALVRPEWPSSFFIWVALSGMTGGGFLMAAPSMLADIIDTDELESGLRREGSFIGVNNFIQKCAASLGALWVGPGLSLAGYNGLAPEQSQQTLLMMRLLYVCPVVFNLLVLLIISRFPLTSKAMAEVRRSIDVQRGLQSEGTPRGG